MARSGKTKIRHAGRAGGQRLYTYLVALASSAFMLGLSYPQPGWGFLAHVALVPAGVLAVRAQCLRRLMWTSYVLSLSWWLFMLRWLIPVTGGGFVLLAALMAIYWPATLLVFRLLHARWRVPAVLALPMALVTFELVRSFWPAGGFAWFMLGHSQAPYEPDHGVSRLIQIADLFGDHGASFLVAMTSGLIVDLLTMPWYQPAGGGRMRRSRKLTTIIFLWATVLGGAWGYGHYRIGKDLASEAGPLVAVIQTAVAQSNKTTSSQQQRENDWQALLALTRRAAREGPDLIVWPETVVPAAVNHDAIQYFKQVQSTWQKLTDQELAASDDVNRYRQLADELRIPFEELPAYMAKMHGHRASYHSETAQFAAELGVPLIVGAPSQFLGDRPRRYNSVYLYHADGTQDSKRYDKIHRVPFGEYIPWVDSWPWLKGLFIKYISPYERDYSLTAGTRPTRFDVQGVRLVAPICFEDTVARACRRLIHSHQGKQTTKHADVLVNVTNDAWYWPVERLLHLQIAVFRSIENRVPTARSVNTGVSGFISSVGRVGPTLAQAGSSPYGEGFVVHTIRVDRRITIFGRFGHAPITVVAVLTMLLTMAGLFRRKSVKRTM